jgi:hypothetical protein
LPKVNAEMISLIHAVTTRISIYPKDTLQNAPQPKVRTLHLIDVTQISTNQTSNKDIFNPFILD